MPTITVKNAGSASRTYYDAKGRMVTIKAGQHRTFEAHEESIKRIDSGARKGDSCSIIASEDTPDKRTNEQALGEVRTQLADDPATTHVAEIKDIPAADPNDPEGLNTPAPVLDPTKEMDDGEEPGDAQPQDIAARDEARVPSTAGGPEAAATANRLEAALRPTSAPARAPATRPAASPARAAKRR